MPIRSPVAWLLASAITLMATATGAAAPLPEEHRVGARTAVRVAASPAARFEPWRRLREQMTKQDVLEILGPPPWTDRSLLFEFWMYEVRSTLASGVIVFEQDRVFSWRLPSLGE